MILWPYDIAIWLPANVHISKGRYGPPWREWGDQGEAAPSHVLMLGPCDVQPSGPAKETACDVVQPQCLIYQGCSMGGGTWEHWGGKSHCVLQASTTEEREQVLGGTQGYPCTDPSQREPVLSWGH